MMNINDKIYIAGAKGMVGSAFLRNLQSKGFVNFVFTPHSEYDLINQQTVENFFEKERPKYVFLAAAKVGGIFANNTYRAQFIYENLMVQNNIIHSAYKFGTKKLLFLGSSCIYPKDAPQPMKEEYLLSNVLEPTNEPYAIAKIAGIKMCESYYREYGCDFISVMPTNLYGPNDNYNLETSHVLPALIRKFHEAKIKKQPIVQIWGTGKPRREFMYVDDMVEACYLIMKNLNAEELYNEYKISHINVGLGCDISIEKLAKLISKVVGFTGDIIYDTNKLDGMKRKMLDISYLNNLGFKPKTSIDEGIKKTYQYFLNDYK
jgi:GDP-L-fucose synthase